MCGRSLKSVRETTRALKRGASLTVAPHSSFTLFSSSTNSASGYSLAPHVLLSGPTSHRYICVCIYAFSLRRQPTGRTNVQVDVIVVFVAVIVFVVISASREDDKWSWLAPPKDKYNPVQGSSCSFVPLLTSRRCLAAWVPACLGEPRGDDEQLRFKHTEGAGRGSSQWMDGWMDG